MREWGKEPKEETGEDKLKGITFMIFISLITIFFVDMAISEDWFGTTKTQVITSSFTAPAYTDLNLERVGDKLNITFGGEYATLRGYFFYEGDTYTFSQASSYGVTYDSWINYNTGTNSKFGGKINVSNVNQAMKDNGYFVVFELIDKSEGLTYRKEGDSIYLNDNVRIVWKDYENPSNKFEVYNSTTVYLTNNGNKFHDTLVYDPDVLVGNKSLGINNNTYYNSTDGTIRLNLTLGNGTYISQVFAINSTNATNLTVNSYSTSGFEIQGSLRTSNGTYKTYDNTTAVADSWTCTQTNRLSSDYDCSKMYDGKTSTAYVANSMPTELVFNLKKNYSIEKIELFDPDASNRHADNISINISMDNQSWTQFYLINDMVFTGSNTLSDWDNFTYGSCLVGLSDCGYGDGNGQYGTGNNLYFNAQFIKITIPNVVAGLSPVQYYEIRFYGLNQTFGDYQPYQSFSSGVDTKIYNHSSDARFMQIKKLLNSDGVTSPIIYNFNSTLYNLSPEGGVADTTSPTVNLIKPANNTLWTSSNTLDFNYSASDDVGITNCSLYINNTLNSSFTTNTNFTNTAVGNGNYNWFVNCSDAVPNWGYSGTYNLTINYDITKPSSNISINNTSPKINQVINVSMNVSDETGLSYCWFYNNMSNLNSSLITLSGTSGSCSNITTINLTQGKSILFRGYVNDTSNNLNWSDIIITVANSIPSTPIITFPVNNSNYTSIPYINYSSSDADSDSITYKIYINGTLNISTATNVTQWNASDGYYNLTISAWDGYNTSSNSSVVRFILDATLPTISNLINRTTDDGTSIFYTNDNIYCNATVIDNLAGINTVILSWNDSTNVWHNSTVTSSTSLYSSIITSTTLSSAGDKWLGWRYYANDSAGNMQVGTIVNYFVNSLTLPIPPSGATGAGASGSAGARGGGCDAYADQYKRCFYVGEDIMCHEGCQQGYTCGKDYRCYLTNAGMITSPYYLIVVDVTEGNYKISTNVIANITIINKNNYSDENGTLLSYMEDPKGIRYHQEYKELKFIPLACPGARYEEGLCARTVYGVGDSTFEPNKTMISRKMALPLNATLGEWKFYAEFSSSSQPKIKLYDKFKVYTPGYFWIFAGITTLIAGFTTVHQVRKKRKSKKEVEEGGIEDV